MYCWYSMGVLAGYNTTIDDYYVAVSGGSIAAAISLCRVDIEYCLLSAPATAVRIGGVYTLLNTWLECVLPTDAHIQCTDRLIIVSRTLSGSITYTNRFETRTNLIDTILTSCNLPVHGEFCRRAFRSGFDALAIPDKWYIQYPGHELFSRVVVKHPGITTKQLLVVPSLEEARCRVASGYKYALDSPVDIHSYLQTHLNVVTEQWWVSGFDTVIITALQYVLHG
jgi:hypothetical protein